jgi:hypothetical protein
LYLLCVKSYELLTEEDWVQSQASSCEACGGEIGAGGGFSLITLVGINFLSVKKMGNLYRLDAAESKMVMKLPHHPLLSREEPLNANPHFY